MGGGVLARVPFLPVAARCRDDTRTYRESREIEGACRPGLAAGHAKRVGLHGAGAVRACNGGEGLVWVEAVRDDDSPGSLDEPGPWTAAWDQLLLLLNERRDALLRHLEGGLMMVAPTAVKPRARVAAPDLWSIRAVVIELPAQVVDPPVRHGDGTERARDLHSDTDEETSPASMRFRQIDALLAKGEARKATALAREAVATLRPCRSASARRQWSGCPGRGAQTAISTRHSSTWEKQFNCVAH